MNRQILKLYRQGCGVIDTAELLGISTDQVIEALEGSDATTKMVQDMRQGSVLVQSQTNPQRSATAQ